MHVLSDYLVGIFIAGMILFIFFALKFKGDTTTTDATLYRAAKIGSLSLVQAIERDFNNIGSQFLPDTHLELDPEYALVDFDTSGIPAYFTFMAQTDSTQPAQQVRYEWQEMGKTVQVGGGTKQLIEIRRLVDGALDGMSTNMITQFEVHPLTCDSTTSWITLNGPSSKVRQLLVRMRAVSPLGPGDAIEEVRWEKMFRPVNIWRQWKLTEGC